MLVMYEYTKKKIYTSWCKKVVIEFSEYISNI